MAGKIKDEEVSVFYLNLAVRNPVGMYGWGTGGSTPKHVQ
ncbi:Hypothetical protein CulFRC58_0972 [Corynebacterium ulcerans FRC58]|uniref:Uncharacterized protein n=1 Tax=Corynebacterium ulcerans FRC58 TaxID=1408268 RepID=A0ABN4H187_CORUL|nr:Hypothetical protein CulFRC58_0972 [Corynebacterium ulcerans FRC58]